MQVGLSGLRKVKVDYNVYGQDVYTSWEDIWAHQAPGLSIFEIMENPIKIKIHLLTYYDLTSLF